MSEPRHVRHDRWPFPMPSATVLLDYPADDFKQDRAKVHLQLELVELVIRCHDGQHFPAPRQGIVVALRAHLHPEPLGDIKTDRTAEAVNRTSTEITEAHTPESAEVKPVLRLPKHLPGQAERLTREMCCIGLHGISHHLQLKAVVQLLLPSQSDGRYPAR